MAEYINVEKPFLDKLRQIGWEVYDNGSGGIPEDPTESFRISFKDVILKEKFEVAIKKINPWISDDQFKYCFEKITEQGNKDLLTANKDIFNLLLKGITLPGKNELTGVDNPTVHLVDFADYRSNSFIAINQFRVDTPNRAKKCIIPDIVCFVNGMPFIVIECKDVYSPGPLSESFRQIERYSNQRDDFFSKDEGEEKLFHTNLFSVITHGLEARFGTICSNFDYFLKWVDIFPEEYKKLPPDNTIEITPNSERQEVLILGMFNHEILIDILKNFTLFMQLKSGQDIKIICRYQQYRAVRKMVERLKGGNDFKQRSGVIWHTQGSGKSLTMAFLVRKMRSTFDLKDYKILMVVDRIDLEDQLTETAELVERTNAIETKQDLVLLESDTNNLNMVMLHKFIENQKITSETLLKLGVIPKFTEFPLINDSEKILILVDEAHRSQGNDMGKNLFLAFPNATRIGFTGTPLITERHKKQTAERFYQIKDHYIDTYKMNDAVADGATVDIKYIGKKTSDKIRDKEVFDLEYEQTFKNRTEEERQEIQKRYGTMVAFLESRERIIEISNDIIEHYVSEILSNGFKAQVVASSIIAAVRYKIVLNELIAKRFQIEDQLTGEDRNESLISRLKILKAHAIVSGMGTNEEDYITAARKEAIEDDAINNFKKDFDPIDPDKKLSGIGILCVCDKLITGFDAPIEQVMYLDKNLREHDLLQAIARVNRTKKGKTHGLVVDYFGITKNLNLALGIYTDQEANDNKATLSEFKEYFKDINDEIPELELRYNKIIQFFNANGIGDFEDFLQQKTDSSREIILVEKVIEIVGELKLRAEFDILVKNYFDRLDLLFSEAETQRKYWIPAKRIGYLLWRIQYHYKDSPLDIGWASEKVRRLIDQHLESMGIKQNVDEVSIFSDDFPIKINSLYGNSKSKASAMVHALRGHIKVSLQNSDPAMYRKFDDRINELINKYQNNWDQLVVELEELRQEAAAGRSESELKVPIHQAPYFDLICLACEHNEQNTKMPELIKLSNSVMSAIFESIVISDFWSKADETIKLTGKIEQLIRFSGVISIETKDKEITSDILKLTKNNHVEILRCL
ncbi:MAG: HsdR family type I site-specific deoxyribonuclease [Chitinophagaceae bacterium]|nr:HsdR family type I site-specific deoxyribonuclease [Chitinophagaceae bacterium]